MPNAELSHPPASVLWRGKVPSLQEFNAMLNVIPTPGLIIDRSRETVLLGNSALLKLTAFSQTELNGASAADLFPGLELTQLAPGDEQVFLIRRRQRDPFEVFAQVTALDSNGQWLLILLTPSDLHRQTQVDRRELILRKLLELARLSEEPDLIQALNRAIEICKGLFETDLVAVYQADSDFPQLTKMESTGGENNIFPPSMPSSDLIRLSSPTIWKPGKRVQTEIHKYARIANLSYVASTPLGQGKALFGMFVVGDTQKDPFDIFQNAIEIAGAQISMIIQHFLLTENLSQEVEKYQRLLTIHNSVFENSQEGIAVLSKNLTIREINPAAEWMLGYTNWEVQNQPVENILIGPERLIPALEAACRGIPTHNIGNVNLHRRNGQSFPAHLQTIPVQTEGQILAVIVFMTDVSAHEEIRQRTQQLEHRAILGDVTAVFAHEVRNPINNISTGLQLMSMRLSPDDPNLDVINRMDADCTRLNHLMESVLSFSRPMEHKFEPLDLASLLKRMLDRWRPRLARVNVEPFFQCAEETPKILGDPRALEQVFTNLISNAVEAMSKKGGTLAVKLGPSEAMTTPPQVEVRISDDGPGIPDEIKDRIFEPFVSNKTSGTGLGLAITKRIVTAHHGSIKLDTFPGGTVFCVHLPAFPGE
jgi:two-component system, NtrC family, sensor histidine kinase AtoS